MVLSKWGALQEGGTGKTTLATNIAVCAAHAGKKVLLIDADEQRSASDWANQREASHKDHCVTTISMIGNRIHTQILKMKDNYDAIIVDAGAEIMFLNAQHLQLLICLSFHLNQDRLISGHSLHLKC